MRRAASSRLPFALGIIAGAIAGAWFMAVIGDWDHVRRYNTEAENWSAFVTVPFGFVFGGLLGWLLVLSLRHVHEYDGSRGAGAWLPLRGRWLAYLRTPLIFAASVAAVYTLVAVLVYDLHQPFNATCAVLLPVWAILLIVAVLWTARMSRPA